MFRFDNWGRYTTDDALADRTADARFNQILLPLLSIVEDNKVRRELLKAAAEYHGRRTALGPKTDAA